MESLPKILSSSFGMPRAVLLLTALLVLPGAAAAQIAWQPWSDAVFEQARREDRFVFLYLEAVWCHWCHVMQRETLADPRVQQALARDYVAVKVDHDANPLLANRYRDYGWPALIWFAPDGTEIVKRAGYIAPENFARLLQAIIKDPSPEAASPPPPRAAPSGGLTAPARQHLLRLHDASYDEALGGLRTAQKFLDRDSVEYAIVHRTQAAERRKAEQTLDAAQALLDPVWGGAYQYSTGGVWTNPHYEKIMRVQAGYLRVYALAYAALGRAQDCRAAQAIRDYLLNFFRSPHGAFYASQDADLKPGEKAQDYFALDDAGRRARGMPRLDRNLYAQENGQAAEALAAWFEASGDAPALAAAVAAAEWALQNRARPGGGFTHGKRDVGGPFLGDTLALGRAFLQLYRATAERRWLRHAQAAARFIEENFHEPAAGYRTAAKPSGPVRPLPTLEENISLARFFNLLHAYTGDAGLKAGARHALAWLGGMAPQLQIEEIGIVLADDELARDPLHLTVVGDKDDPAAAELFRLALRAPDHYKRVEWLDRREGPLPHGDVEYPSFERAAGYVCTQRRCSAPSFTAVAYSAALQRLSAN